MATGSSTVVGITSPTRARVAGDEKPITVTSGTQTTAYAAVTRTAATTEAVANAPASPAACRGCPAARSSATSRAIVTCTAASGRPMMLTSPSTTDRSPNSATPRICADASRNAQVPTLSTATASSTCMPARTGPAGVAAASGADPSAGEASVVGGTGARVSPWSGGGSGRMGAPSRAGTRDRAPIGGDRT